MKATASGKAATKAKPASAMTTAVRVAVEVSVARKHLLAFEYYGQHYNVPALHLLQMGAYGQANAVVDDPYSFLEFAEECLEFHDLEIVTLEFCHEAHAILSRASELLRRPLPDFLQGLLALEGRNLTDEIAACLEKDGIFGWDMCHWADQAIEFERLARRGKTPGAGTCEDGWDVFNLRRPEERLARLALKGEPQS